MPPARRIHGGTFIEMEDRRAQRPAVPELLLDAGNLGHAPHLLEGADLDDEVDALGGGDGRWPDKPTRS